MAAFLSCLRHQVAIEHQPRKNEQHCMKQFLIGTLLTVAFAISASGAQLTINYGNAHYGSGGEFRITSGDAWATSVAANYAASAKSGGGFETFCIEYNEHFSPGSIYYYQISPDAIKGGMTTSDPISAGTGFLYGLYARGLLSGYSDINNLYASGPGALQQTLWFLEGEQATSGGSWDSLLIGEFGSLANARLTIATSAHYGTVTAASFGVAALNLGTTPSGDGGLWSAQDQLVYQGGGFQTTPDGGSTLILLGSAVGSFSLLRRRLR